ncbi:hypothetical protein X474_10930 [Dethiosulfatarculus sandiegensis]|uniref:Uncharacterized protein n=1 Tax=Dethiosulfatarculus sandiegensis TaxID=1429043 RepID=A0A0D2HTI7_9BACT|nr:hypothetical protein X474_10930 [Dethiosulfatarculus sandiegensis]
MGFNHLKTWVYGKFDCPQVYLRFKICANQVNFSLKTFIPVRSLPINSLYILEQSNPKKQSVKPFHFKKAVILFFAMKNKKSGGCSEG